MHARRLNGHKGDREHRLNGKKKIVGPLKGICKEFLMVERLETEGKDILSVTKNSR